MLLSTFYYKTRYIVVFAEFKPFSVYAFWWILSKNILPEKIQFEVVGFFPQNNVQEKHVLLSTAFVVSLLGCANNATWQVLDSLRKYSLECPHISFADFFSLLLHRDLQVRLQKIDVQNF